MTDDDSETREVIMEWIARTLFLDAYASFSDEPENVDNPDILYASMGADWVDVLAHLETPEEAVQSAAAIVRDIEAMNGMPIESLYHLAASAQGTHYRPATPSDFGYSMAMEAVGSGVAWEDNHPEPPGGSIKVPSGEFYVWYNPETREVEVDHTSFR